MGKLAAGNGCCDNGWLDEEEEADEEASGSVVGCREVYLVPARMAVISVENPLE